MILSEGTRTLRAPATPQLILVTWSCKEQKFWVGGTVIKLDRNIFNDNFVQLPDNFDEGQEFLEKF